MIIASETTSRNPTIASTIRLRRRSVISVRCQDEQQPAIVVVGGEDVGGGRLRAGTFFMPPKPPFLDAHAPLKRCADGIAILVELEVENFLDRPAHHVLLAEPGELAHAASDTYYARVGVANEESRIRSGVIVVQQLEQEAEAALLAAASALGETGRPLGAERAVSAVGADEVRHCGSV